MRKLRLIFKRWELFFVAVIPITIVFIILIFDFPTFLDILKNPTQQILIAALISTIIALFISYLGIKADAQIQYFEDLEGLLDEMQNNYENICNFPAIVEKNYIDWEKTGTWKWLPKDSSYTNWGDGQNFHLKYCSSSAYFNFVNKGHIIHDNYLKIPTEHIAHFYQMCMDFSINLQIYENGIRQNGIEAPLNIAVSISAVTSSHVYLNVPSPPPVSRKGVCDFLKNNFYPSYAFKNDLNEGIIGEYKIVKDSLIMYFDLEDIFGEKTMDETTRKNKIEKISLQIDLQSSYYTILGILFAVFAFIIQTPNYTDTVKLIYSSIIGVVVIALIVKLNSGMKEINKLFE